MPQSASISRRGAAIRLVPWFLHLVFAAATQGTLFDCLALESREACVPGSHATVTIGETVLGRLPLPEHCTDSRLKHTPRFSEKEADLLIQELWPEDYLQEPMEGLSGNGGW